MLRTRMLALVGWLAVVGVGSAEPGDAKLDGKWVVVSMTRDGKEDEGLRGAVRENAGNKYTVTPSKGPKIEGTFTLDPAASPKTMVMKPTTGRYKGKTLTGIYLIEGDKLTLCFSESGEAPKEFTSKPGSGHVLVIHDRAK